jgi:hypothetical protein
LANGIERCSNAFSELKDILCDDSKVAVAKLVTEFDTMYYQASVKKQDRILTEPSGQYQLGNGQFM